MTEPSGGSDLANLKTTAKRDGSDFVINGSEVSITNGFIRRPGDRRRPQHHPRRRGPRHQPVRRRKGMPWFEPGCVLDKVGQPEADTAELFFTDVRVPEENLIGELDRGFHHSRQNLAQVAHRAGGVLKIAHARFILDETLDYVKQRTAFGRPVGSFQHNAFVLADMVTRAEVTQAYVDQQVEALDVRGELTAVYVAKAKMWTSEVQGQILDACVQLHGGYGLTCEDPGRPGLADARVTGIWAGSNQIKRRTISRSLAL